MFMRLTNFTDFGLRALILLADRQPEILSAAAIADYFKVSRHRPTRDPPMSLVLACRSGAAARQSQPQ
jgi:hypothetical protein